MNSFLLLGIKLQYNSLSQPGFPTNLVCDCDPISNADVSLNLLNHEHLRFLYMYIVKLMFEKVGILRRKTRKRYVGQR